MINRLCTEDIASVSKMQPDGWDDIEKVFSFYVKSQQCFPVKYVINETIVGVGSAICFGNSGWIGHIIVHNDFRCRGIGSAVVQYLKEYLLKEDISTISLIATKMGESVYKKAGFISCAEYSFYEGDTFVDYTPHRNIVPYGRFYQSQLIDLDHKLTGEDRSMLLDNLENAHVYVENETLQGYYIPNLGQGTIVADNSIAGIELMKLRLKTNLLSVLPADNFAGISFLEKVGFIKTASANRMVYGDSMPFDPQNIFNRISGNFG